MFIDIYNNIYINDRHNSRVRLWSETTANWTIIISQNLNYSSGIFVTNNGDIYIDNGAYNGRVDKWSKDLMSRELVMYVNSSCFGLFVDMNDTLYCSLPNEHRVIKHLLGSGPNVTITVAGDGTPGKTSTTLNFPIGIFVDRDFNLYVADTINNRIQFFKHGQLDGVTLVGSEVLGSVMLYHPTSITVQDDGYLFIVDRLNHSILRFRSNESHCVIGCSGIYGAAPNQLNLPYSISFDTHGNIFVLDENNHRIQKFLLERNICGKFM
jgi:hypothetical protein